jgi:hypothetical protein
MSTEATGDGRPDAVGATEPGAGAEYAAPTPGESDEPGGSDKAEEAGGLGKPSGVDEPSESVEPDDDYGEYAGDEDAESCVDHETLEYAEAVEYDESLEYTEAVEYDEDIEGNGYAEYPEDAAYDEDAELAETSEVAEPQRARRWPRALLATGFVVLALVIVGGAITIVGSLTHGFKKPVKVTYKTSPVFSLTTGDCFDPQGAQSYALVSCDVPHQAEVFATFTLAGAAWPGASAVQAEASGGCASRLTSYVNPQLAVSLTSTYVYPDAVAWQAGTRTVICEVRATSGQLTGSVRGASASASPS